ncbi:conserved hypothetical protein [Sinorhizobium medicae]|uniref:Uncharacterized protein n=1 Tax=Sinorhizobium medicae TaxID=110321 RepID=A0A508X2D2_9HYPH|nr:conserved hypothetical protein [Sinorhizobium medicae]
MRVLPAMKTIEAQAEAHLAPSGDGVNRPSIQER